MVAACDIARQKFPASSNGVGSRASSDSRLATQFFCRLDAASSARLGVMFSGCLGVTFNAKLPA